MQSEISNIEAVKMMIRCKQEIVEMRAIIKRLTPKAEAYDNFSIILRLLPQTSMGMGEDIVWILDKRIEELTPPKHQPVE